MNKWKPGDASRVHYGNRQLEKADLGQRASNWPRSIRKSLRRSELLIAISQILARCSPPPTAASGVSEFTEIGVFSDQELVYSAPSAMLPPSAPTLPSLHHSMLPISIFRYISNSTKKYIAHSIVFTWDHWHPTPHCGRGWRF